MKFYPQSNAYIMINGEDRTSGPRPSAWYPDQYESAVYNNLERLQSFRTGAIILETVRDLARRAEQPGGAQSKLFIAPNFNPDRSAHVLLVNLSLNSPIVFFTPRDYNEGNYGLSNRKAVLFHELFHGVRGLSGQRSAQRETLDARYSGARSYPNVEEFYAVMVANIFASEARLVLRDGYSEYTVDSDPTFRELCNQVTSGAGGLARQRFTPTNLAECLQNTGQTNFPNDAVSRFSLQFAEVYEELIQRLRTQTPSLYDRLRTLGQDITPFNPIRDIETIRAQRIQSRP